MCTVENPLDEEWADYSSAAPDPSPLQATIPPEFAGLRLDQALAKLFPEHSRNRLQGWLKAGRVLLDGAVRDPKFKVWGREAVIVEPELAPEALAAQAEPIPLDIVHEDASIIVIAKPVGLVVHPGSGNWSGTLMNALLHHDPALRGVPRAGIVHRLDKDTSGLLVVARTLTAQTDLVRQLQARSVKRHYLALAHGKTPESGDIDAPIGRHPVQRVKMAVVGNGREALTSYVLRERFPHASLVECRLATGRTHQIRVHMAYIGHPLVGDATYGKPRSADVRMDAFPRQALHAWRLGLIHPVSGEAMSWEVPLPDDFRILLESLRADADTNS